MEEKFLQIEKRDNKGFIILIAITVITFVVWQIPFVGRYILYPFTILGTWFHEMGHGVVAMMMGGGFERLEIYADGSGLAYHSGSLFLGPIGRAAVAAGGPLGPPLIGSLLIILSNKPEYLKPVLVIFGAIILISVLIWVRSWFGVLVLPLYALAIIFVALKASPVMQKFTLQFLGVQGFFSVYESMGYLFSSGGVVDGSSITSDTGVIADNLFLPHWIWAASIIALSIFLFIKTLSYANRQPKGEMQKPDITNYNV
jgi:hypothetical protein